MRNWRNRIYSNLVSYFQADDVEIVVDNNHKLVKDKNIYFQLLSNEELANDLVNTNENAQNVLIQLECYTKTLDDGYEIADKVVEAMKQMAFTKVFGATLTDNIDTNYKRLVMRFSQIVGSGNTINKL